MRYVLIFVGAAVVAWLLAKGIRAFISERRSRASHAGPTNKALPGKQHTHDHDHDHNHDQ